jgi:hypothetical protein
MKNVKLKTDLKEITQIEVEQVYGGSFRVDISQEFDEKRDHFVEFDHKPKELSGVPVKPKLPIEL